MALKRTADTIVIDSSDESDTASIHPLTGSRSDMVFGTRINFNADAMTVVDSDSDTEAFVFLPPSTTAATTTTPTTTPPPLQPVESRALTVSPSTTTTTTTTSGKPRKRAAAAKATSPLLSASVRRNVAHIFGNMHVSHVVRPFDVPTLSEPVIIQSATYSSIVARMHKAVVRVLCKREAVLNEERPYYHPVNVFTDLHSEEVKIIFGSIPVVTHTPDFLDVDLSSVDSLYPLAGRQPNRLFYTPCVYYRLQNIIDRDPELSCFSIPWCCPKHMKHYASVRAGVTNGDSDTDFDDNGDEDDDSDNDNISCRNVCHGNDNFRYRDNGEHYITSRVTADTKTFRFSSDHSVADAGAISDGFIAVELASASRARPPQVNTFSLTQLEQDAYFLVPYERAIKEMRRYYRKRLECIHRLIGDLPTITSAEISIRHFTNDEMLALVSAPPPLHMAAAGIPPTPSSHSLLDFASVDQAYQYAQHRQLYVKEACDRLEFLKLHMHTANYTMLGMLLFHVWNRFVQRSKSSVKLESIDAVLIYQYCLMRESYRCSQETCATAALQAAVEVESQPHRNLEIWANPSQRINSMVSVANGPTHRYQTGLNKLITAASMMTTISLPVGMLLISSSSSLADYLAWRHPIVRVAREQRTDNLRVLEDEISEPLKLFSVFNVANVSLARTIIIFCVMEPGVLGCYTGRLRSVSTDYDNDGDADCLSSRIYINGGVSIDFERWPEHGPTGISSPIRKEWACKPRDRLVQRDKDIYIARLYKGRRRDHASSFASDMMAFSAAADLFRF